MALLDKRASHCHLLLGFANALGLQPLAKCSRGLGEHTRQPSGPSPGPSQLQMRQDGL